MFRVMKGIQFCYGHRLLDYKGRCANPHGHNGKVEVELASEALDTCDMVYEFADLQAIVKKWIDENLDHRMLLRHDDPLLAPLRKLGEPVYVMERNPTAEAIAEAIYRFAKEQGLPVTQVRLWESDTACASYSE